MTFRLPSNSKTLCLMPRWLLLFGLLGSSLPNPLSAQEALEDQPVESTGVMSAELPAEIRPTGYLLLPRVGDYRRGPIHIDPVEYALVQNNDFQPKLGDQVRSANGIELFWQSEEKQPPEQLMIGGYAYTTFDLPAAGVMLLDATGCATANLNGEWIAGNPYSISVPKIPVNVKQGTNTLLIHFAKPNARPIFSRIDTAVLLDETNTVLPDVVATLTKNERYIVDSPLLVASLPIINASNKTLSNLQIVSQLHDGEPLISAIDDIAPMSIVRVPFKIRAFQGEVNSDNLKLQVNLVHRSNEKEIAKKPIDQAELIIKVVAERDLQSHTFVSKIDASVQQYAFLPAISKHSPATDSGANKQSLVVQLHDAGDNGYELLTQSEALIGIHQIAPHGRGVYGFDWEDWSATDAIEAIADLRLKLALETERTAISGQGMGGHGALWLATNHPDQFAAVEASNGWLNLLLPIESPSNDSRLKSLNELLNRRASAADFFGLVTNLAATSIRLHQNERGSATAMSEIRELRSELGKFHFDFSYQENSIGVDQQASVVASALQPALQRREELDANQIEFVTPDLAINSELAWAKIDAVVEQGKLASIRLLRDSQLATFRGSTDNVLGLTLSLRDVEEAKKVQIRLDSQPAFRIDWPARAAIIRLERDKEGVWGLPKRPRSFFRRAVKTADRMGGLKSVFANYPLLIYGTQGSEAENNWAEAKARYDAETFRYRGNGRLDYIADRNFQLDKYRDRSLILYGNFDTNSVAKRLLIRSPVKAYQGRIDIGPRPELGDDLAILLVQPRLDSRTASIALIGGTGIQGMRATTRLRYFWSGVHYPDLLIFGSESLNSIEASSPIDNVRAAGYFGPEWGLRASDLVWRDVAL